MRCKVILYIILLFSQVAAQVPVTPFDLPDYGFVQYPLNRFELVQHNPGYRALYTKFDNLIRNGEDRIRIVHLGGSHLQADIYTHRIRQELQSLYPGILGSRGFFFPYALARTNSPSNLWMTWSGEWQTCRNTQATPAFPMGISGITAALVSPTGSLTLVARYDTLRRYDFNRIRIFCNAAESGVVPEVNPGCAVSPPVIDPSGEFVEYQLTRYSDTLTLFVTQSDSTPKPFQLYGISLESDDPGVIYNAIGVNGAKLESYLRCERFIPQLRALEPDWVIVSIGTNEGNTRHFDPEAYRSDYIRLIDSIRYASPGAAILLTVPNDSYLFKRYSNPNTARMREIIFDLAQSFQCGVWDFYTVMGGLNSAMAWYNQGLMNRDRIHFNRPGYLFKGDLFYSAFMKSWDDHLLQVAAEVEKPPIARLHTQNPYAPIPLLRYPVSGIRLPASSIQYPFHD